MEEIIARLMESHLSERSYDRISYNDREKAESESISQALKIHTDSIITIATDMKKYLDTHSEKELSDKEIIKFLQDMRLAIHSIGILNAPERYHKKINIS